MSSWKRVLTTDDVGLVVSSNLATANLSQTDSERIYLLPTSVSGSRLLFQGNVNGNTENILRIQADANSTSINNSFAYTTGLRIGNFDLSGATGSNGYYLPQHDSAVGAGEIIVSDNFATDTGGTSFKTFDEWLNPDFTGDGFTTVLSYGHAAAEPREDKVIVWDDDNGTYKPSSINELAKVVGYKYNLGFGRSASVTTNGTVNLRTLNGTEGTGYVVLEKSRILGVSYAGNFSSGTGSGNAGVRLKINGTATFTGYQSYQYYQVNGYTNGVLSGYILFPIPLTVNAGDRIDLNAIYVGDNLASVANQSAMILLDTHGSDVDAPLTVS